ncbi:MAG: hypothetical protein KDD63_22270, partial [Bacteroidetes bacterium]|nr:hypothetical protein [Bacteroidota bacterium]
MHEFLKKYVLQICFWSGLILQLFHTHTYFTYQGSDRNLQILAAINLLEGNGYSVQEALVDDLSQTVFSPLKGWPPGYSLLIIPFYLLTKDIFLSAEIIAWLGIFLCFSGAHFLLQLLNPHIHRWVYPSLFLFWGISFTPFHFTAAADEWALGCFLWGTFFWLKLWLHHDKKWLLTILLGTLFFWMAGLIRYAYYPFLLVPVGIGGLVYWMNRDGKTWLTSSIFSVVALVSLWMISTPMVGTVNALSDVYANQKVYWENLAWMDAFPVKSFFYLSVEGMANKVGGIAPVFGTLMKGGMLILSLVLLSILFSWKETG